MLIWKRPDLVNYFLTVSDAETLHIKKNNILVVI